MPNRLLLVIVMAALLCGVAAADRQERVAVVAPAAYDGAFMIDQPLEKQAKNAGAIVVAGVTDVRSAKTGTSIETTVSLKIEKYIKGSGPANLKMTLPGGSVGSDHVAVGGVPNFLAGERVLLLLDGASNPKLLSLWQSKYSLAGTQAHQPVERPSVAIKDLEDELGQALNKAVTIPVNEDEAVVVSAFYVSCPGWPTADLPVPFEVNPAIPGGSHSSTTPPSGMSFAQLSYESWHAWQALSASYPAFSYAGTTTPPRTGLVVDGLNTVSWGDIGTVGVLGINQCAWSGSSRVDSDTVIDSANFSWDWDNSISASSYSLRSVMEHELGHGLSLGHTCSTDPVAPNYSPSCGSTCNGLASTPLMCPAVQSGQRKTILTDDSNGAAAIYPLSGVAPGAPSGVTLTPGSGSNSLSWTASSGSKLAYDIERGNSACSGGWTPAGTVPSSATSFVDNNFGAGLPAGTYCYQVRALGVGGDSGWTNSTAAVPVYGVNWDSHGTPASMPTFGTTAVPVSFTNTGSLTWPAAGSNPVRLSYHWRSGACPGGSYVVWDGPRATLSSNVATGQTANLTIGVVAPSVSGTYCLVYDLVREGVTWFSNQGASTRQVQVSVQAPVYGVNWGSHTTPANMGAGAITAASVSFTNTGSLLWQAAPPNAVRLSHHWRSGSCPGTSYVVWDGPRSNLPSNISPGGTVSSLSINVTAPSTPGSYCLVYDVVREGVTWFSNQGANVRRVDVNVGTPVYGVSFGSDTTPSTMGAGTATDVDITFTNTGSLTWESGGANPVHLSYHWRAGACNGTSSAVWDGQRASLPSDVSQSETVTDLTISVLAPSTPGVYCLVYDLVREGVAWFSNQGASVERATVTIQ